MSCMRSWLQLVDSIGRLRVWMSDYALDWRAPALVGSGCARIYACGIESSWWGRDGVDTLADYDRFYAFNEVE
jgi:hypothetical protein